MKKLLFILAFLLPSIAFAQLTVPQGGTGTTTFPDNYVLIGTTNPLRITAVSTSSLGISGGGGGSTFATTSVSATYPILWNTSTAVISTAISTSTISNLPDLVQTGTITSGTWQGTAIADTYISSSGNWNTAYTDRITGANYPLSITSNVLSVVATSSENCTVTCFLSHNVSQWTNDAGYLTANQTITLSGAVSGSGTTAITTSYAGTLGNSLGGTNQNSSAWSGLAAVNAGVWSSLSTTSMNASITGNAGTATALQNARTINGISFNGTANIVVASTTLLSSDNNTFTGNTIFVASTTHEAQVNLVGASSTLFSTSNLWDTALTSGDCVQASTGGLLVSAAAACGTGTVTSVTATAPIFSTGGTTPVISWAGLATTTNLVAAQVLFATSASGVGGNTAFTFSTTGNTLLTVTNASTTNLTVGTYFQTAGMLDTASSTIGGGSITTGLTVNGTATTTAFINTGLTSALALFNANHLETAYGGATDPCTSQVPTTLSALGVLGGCLSINNAWWSGTQLSVANGGTNDTSLTGNQILYTNSAGTQVLSAASSSLDLPNTALQNSSVTVNTTAPLGGGGAVSLGGSALSLTCSTCDTFAWPFTVVAASSVSTTSAMGIFASSTIGGGSITTGLTVNGGATTTDEDNAWVGITTPTRYLTLSSGTSTTFTASTTGSAYSPTTVASFAGTVKSIQCLASSTNSFIGVQPFIQSTAMTPSYLVASNTVGTINFTSNNTFTKGQVIGVNFGTTTTDTAQKFTSCTFSVVQTS